jgi:triosephosphate isomerase
MLDRSAHSASRKKSEHFDDVAHAAARNQADAPIRRTLIAGNWKMNGSLVALHELEGIASLALARPEIDVAVALPVTLIAAAKARFPALIIGAEDVHAAERGAYTGSVSAGMIKEIGATFSLIGHSERRIHCRESDADIKAKGEALARHGLGAILCVGETLAQRRAGKAETAVAEQISASLPACTGSGWLAIAYEPVWAIGSGETPTPEEVGRMHRAIRTRLRGLIGTEANAIRLLYGGSVSPVNAAALFTASDVDGALVGGASLSAATFAPIIAAGAKAHER